MSSYLDVREPNHQIHQQVRVLAFVSDHGVVEGGCCAAGGGVLWGGGCPVLPASRWPVPRWPLGISLYFFFFLKVLLLIAFFLRTALFPSSLGILVIFIENLLMPGTMVNVYEFCFDDF